MSDATEAEVSSNETSWSPDAQVLSSNETSSNETTPFPPTTDTSAPMNETLHDSFEDGEPTAVSPPVTDPPVLQDPVYRIILSQQNYTIPHKCYVAITTNSADDTKKHFPVVWCDVSDCSFRGVFHDRWHVLLSPGHSLNGILQFRTPVGLNVTAEIQDGNCDEFQQQSSGDVFTRGVASTIFFPEITEEEKLAGNIEHEYCARLDYLYDVDGTGNHARSVLDKRFPMVVTYLYREEIDEETGQIIDEDLIDVELADENTTEEERDLDLILGLSFLAGAVFMMALIAIVMGGSRKRKKEKQRLQQMMEEGGVDVEITPIVAPVREENEVI